jgi:hypothetical protein
MKAPPVYNPVFRSLRDKFDGLDRSGQERELGKVLVVHVHAMKDERLPFFAQRDDPRPGPKDAQEAVAWLRASHALHDTSDLATYAFELDFVFRLLRFVVKENPFLREEATRLTAAFCKCCLTFSGAQRALDQILDYFVSQGIGGAVTAIDNLCHGCNRPLTGQITLFDGHNYHASCFNCANCCGNLNGVPFVLDRARQLPICARGCGGAPKAVPHTTVHLDRNSFVQPAPARVTEPQEPHRATIEVAATPILHSAPSASSSSASSSSSARNWSCDEVIAKLQALNVSDVEAFRREAIDGAALVSLTEADLKDELGLKLGDRKKVSDLIKSIIQ